MQKTVIITACNFGYVNHLQNFKCFMDRLSFSFIVLALDSRTAKFVRENMPSVSVYELIGRKKVSESSSVFRTPQFNLIGEMKIEGVLRVLRLGYNVLFADIDIAILRDPFPHMIFDNIDYSHTVNQICGRYVRYYHLLSPFIFLLSTFYFYLYCY